MNEQRKADIEFLRKGHKAIGFDPPPEWAEALSRQLPLALKCLEFMVEHGETVMLALDAETSNPRSHVRWDPLIAAIREAPVIE